MKLSQYLIIKHHVKKAYGEWSYSSTILDLGTGARIVVSFTHGRL
jgi:hypothetical protein